MWITAWPSSVTTLTIILVMVADETRSGAHSESQSVGAKSDCSGLGRVGGPKPLIRWCLPRRFRFRCRSPRTGPRFPLPGEYEAHARKFHRHGGQIHLYCNALEFSPGTTFSNENSIYQRAERCQTSYKVQTCAESLCVRKNFCHAARDGATFSWSFCLPPSLIGVKFMAAWTFYSSGLVVCSR